MNYAAEIHARAEQCLREGLTNDELAGVLFIIAQALAAVEPAPRPAYPLVPLPPSDGTTPFEGQWWGVPS